MPQTPHLQHQSIQPQHQPQYHQQAQSPAPAYNQNYASHPATYTPQTPHVNYTPQATPPTQPIPHPTQYTTPHLPPAPPQPQPFPYPPSRTVAPYPPTVQGIPPRSIEVFHLSNPANEAIPLPIREQFHRDDQGRVLFFSTPPIDPVPPLSSTLRHTPAYLAKKAERDKLITEHKRKLAAEAPAREAEAKKARLEAEQARKRQEAEKLDKVLVLLGSKLEKETDEAYEGAFHGDPGLQKHAKEKDDERISSNVETVLKRIKREEERESERKEGKFVNLKNDGRPKVYLDDIDSGIPF
jgi:chromatin structure-remodeling complex subunit RSC1/2